MKRSIQARPELERKVYEGLCIGIGASLLFWPLASSLLSIVLFAWWLFITKPKRASSRQNRWLAWLFASLYFLVLLGVLYSQNKEEAIFKIQQKSALLVFPLLFAFSEMIDEAALKKIGRFFAYFTITGCLYCLLIGFVHYLNTQQLDQLHGYGLVLLKDMSPFILGLCCLVSLLFLYQSLFEKHYKSYPQRVLVIAQIVFLTLFLLLLGNRNILISCLIISAYYYFRLLKGWVYRILFPLLSLLIAVLFIVFNPSLRKQWNDLTDTTVNNTIPLDEDRSLGRSWGGKAIREAIWKCSFEIIRENTWIGVGTGDVQDELQKSYEKRKFYFASRYNRYNAHNQYIQITLEYGIIGLLVFIACLVAPFVTGKAHYPPYFLFLICFMFISLTESVFELSKGIILYSFFNSIFAFTKRKSSEP